ncbi:MAG: ABC transporter ATP-binding protein [Actinomycetes bacterium]
MDAPGGITASGVRRSFGAVEAVRDIDLTAPPGQVTALVGPNGSGKTTLFLVLATLLVPDAGRVNVGGHDPVTEPDAVRALLGWSPDVFGVYDNLTAREYLEFFATAYRLPVAERRARADELLSEIHLEQFAQAPVHVLSRGQKQRLGLARALVHRPRVLVLDEPASGLDPRSRVDLRELLRAQAAQGVAVLVSSHILSDLEEVADRVVFVEGGRTVGEHAVRSLPQARSRPWRIRALDDDGLVAALDAMGMAHGVTGPAGVEVSVGSDEEAADLVVALVRAGVRVVSLNPSGGELEAAYLELTEGRR